MQSAEYVVKMLEVRSVVFRKDDDVVHVRNDEVKVMKDFVHHSLEGWWSVPKSIRRDKKTEGFELADETGVLLAFATEAYLPVARE